MRFGAITALLVLACGSSTPPAATPAPAPEAVTPEAPAEPEEELVVEAPPEDEPTPTATLPVNGPTIDDAIAIGIPECDEYLDRIAHCIPRLPPSTRQALAQALSQARAQFRQIAGTPDGPKMLAPACKQALDAARQAFAAMGCQF